MNMFLRLVTATGVVLVLSACGADEQAARETRLEEQAAGMGVDADVTVDESGDVTFALVNSQFGTVGQNLELPAGFPGDLPVDERWNIMSIAQVPPAGHLLQAMTDQNVETVVANLRASLSSQGWEEASFNQPAPSMTTLNFSKDNRMANVNITDSGSQQLSVQLLTMQKPN